MPGNPPEPSVRDRGVTRGSIEMAERTGNTRSMEPGLRAEGGSSNFVVAGGDPGALLLPVNILTCD
jgi:hypothetical protein